MDYSHNDYLHALNMLPQLGPKKLHRIIEHFADIADIIRADSTTFIDVGLDQASAENIITHLQTVDLAHEQAQLEEEGIKLLSWNDEHYPTLLLEIPQSPPLLYYRGTLGAADELTIAIVGTRKISTYGRSIVPEFALGLARHGIPIVSGLAFGVDALAHQTCVDNGFRTVAVVGSGIDNATLYPKHHQYLSEQIIAGGGLIISEYPPKTPAYKQHFIARNRIISGMCAGTLVVEANLKSGALITARHALDQNRSVYAVPGPIYSEGSHGPHSLIRMGAQLVTKASDILEDLRIDASATGGSITLAELAPDEQALVQVLSREPKDADSIVRESGLDPAKATATLTFLEMKGVIRNVGAQQYILTHKIAFQSSNANQSTNNY